MSQAEIQTVCRTVRLSRKYKHHWASHDIETERDTEVGRAALWCRPSVLVAKPAPDRLEVVLPHDVPTFAPKRF